MDDHKRTLMGGLDSICSKSKAYVGSFGSIAEYRQNEADVITLKHYVLNSAGTKADQTITRLTEENERLTKLMIRTLEKRANPPMTIMPAGEVSDKYRRIKRTLSEFKQIFGKLYWKTV